MNFSTYSTGRFSNFFENDRGTNPGNVSGFFFAWLKNPTLSNIFIDAVLLKLLLHVTG
jgi:hypothetical protein